MDNSEPTLENEIQIITIVLDPSNPSPQVDLGNVHPVWALSILQQICEALEVTSPEPDITYNGTLIYSGMPWADDDDDE